jgi:hypothetical protein
MAGLTLGLAGCSTSAGAGGDSASAPSGGLGGFNATQPITLPAGTLIDVRLDQSVSSRQNGAGSAFDATVSTPVIVEGKTVIPQGARAHGRIVESHEGGHLEGVSSLGLALESVEVNGKSFNVDTTEVRRAAGNHKKRNWILIGGGSGLGALIGGIAGGGKGALIGTLAGGAAGTGAAAATGKKEIVLPAETLLKFRLEQPLSIPVRS